MVIQHKMYETIITIKKFTGIVYLLEITNNWNDLMPLYELSAVDFLKFMEKNGINKQ